MAKNARPAAAKAATPPARPKQVAASTEEGTAAYMATGRILIDGLHLEAGDEVHLTELQAYNLAGFCEPIESDNAPDE